MRVARFCGSKVVGYPAGGGHPEEWVYPPPEGTLDQRYPTPWMGLWTRDTLPLEGIWDQRYPAPQIGHGTREGPGTPIHTHMDRQTPVKTLTAHNFVGGR